MAKLEVGQRVRVTGNLHWVGEGTVRALYETNVSVIMLTGKMSGEIGAFRPSDLEPIETFQPGDIVRAFGGAWSTIGSFSKVSHSSMETRARKSGFYRVIFEGENE